MTPRSPTLSGTLLTVLLNISEEVFDVPAKRSWPTLLPTHNCGLLGSLPGKFVSLYASMIILPSCIVKTPIAKT